jgi:peroxiredoxin Q/BCP
MLKAGDALPDLTVPDDSGSPFPLRSLVGQRVVLYFYPKADTPGCTKESCGFRDASGDFAAADTVIVGVSPDGVKDQLKFKEKFSLPFTLLADLDHEIAEAFGVWGEKQFMGKKYMGVSRTTFLIGRDGRIAKVYEKVKPEGHAEEVLADLKAL